MCLVLRDTATYVRDAVLYDRCSTSRVTLFNAMLAIIFLVTAYIVSVVGTEV